MPQILQISLSVLASLVSLGSLFFVWRNSKTALKALSQKTDETRTKVLEDKIDALEKELREKVAEIKNLTDEKFALMQRLFDGKK